MTNGVALLLIYPLDSFSIFFKSVGVNESEFSFTVGGNKVTLVHVKSSRFSPFLCQFGLMNLDLVLQLG